MRTPSKKRPTSRIKSPWPATIFVLLTVLPIQMSLGPLHMTTLRFYIAAMIIPAAMIILRRRDAAWPIDALMTLTALWTVISILKVAPQSGLERAGSVTLDLLGGYVIARAFITNIDTFLATFRVIVICILLSIPFALTESLTGLAPVLSGLAAFPGITTPDILDLPTRLGLNRAQTIFAHPIHYGLFCSSAAALLVMGCQNLHISVRLIGLTAIGLGCFLSLSSGAVLSLGLQVALMIWSASLARIKNHWWILIGITACAYLTIDLIADRSPTRVILSHATFSAHNAHWRELIFEWGMHNLWANPIFGVGSNDWVRPTFMKTNSMDNFWLYMAVKYGLPTLAFLGMAWIGAVATITLARISDAPTNHLRRAWIICFIGLTFTLATVHVWTTIYSYVFFLFGAGLWMIPHRSKAPAKARAKTRVSAMSRGLTPKLTRGQSA